MEVDGHLIDAWLFTGGASQVLFQTNFVRAAEVVCGVPAIVPHLGIRAIGGRSAGACLAVMAAMGTPSRDMRLHHAARVFAPDVRNLPRSWSLDDGALLRGFIAEFIESLGLTGKTIADAEAKHGVRLFVHCLSASDGPVVLPSNTPLELALVATCSIFGAFPPVRIGEHLMLDVCCIAGRDSLLAEMRQAGCARILTTGFATMSAPTPASALSFAKAVLMHIMRDSQGCCAQEILLQHAYIETGSTFSLNADDARHLLSRHWDAMVRERDDAAAVDAVAGAAATGSAPVGALVRMRRRPPPVEADG